MPVDKGHQLPVSDECTVPGCNWCVKPMTGPSETDRLRGALWYLANILAEGDNYGGATPDYWTDLAVERWREGEQVLRNRTSGEDGGAFT